MSLNGRNYAHDGSGRALVSINMGALPPPKERVSLVIKVAFSAEVQKCVPTASPSSVDASQLNAIH